MKYHVAISDFYGTINLWNLTDSELSRVIDAYDLGKSSFFLRGKKITLKAVSEIQIYESNKLDENLDELFSYLEKNNLYSKGLFSKYVAISTLNKIFRETRITDEYIFGEFGYQSENSTLSPSQNEELFPTELFDNTRGYLIRVANQAVESYKNGSYDGSFILCRKLLETLIIECFERFKIEEHIKNENGDYFQLSDLINNFLKETSWTLSRNTKQAIPEIKKIADRSAHNRRFVARKGDIDGIKDDLRVVIEEIIQIIDYKNWKQ